MKDRSEQRKDEILSSIDGIQPAEVPAYFYTRLIARMQNELPGKKESFFLLRPAFLTASLSLLLIINVLFLFRFNDRQGSSSSKQLHKTATIESFAKAYDLNSSPVYE